MNARGRRGAIAALLAGLMASTAGCWHQEPEGLDAQGPAVLGTGTALSANVVVDDGGAAVAVWGHERADESMEVDFAITRGAGWTDPAPLGGSGTQDNWALARTSTGEVAAIWTDAPRRSEGSTLGRVSTLHSARFDETGWHLRDTIVRGRFDFADLSLWANDDGTAIAEWTEVTTVGDLEEGPIKTTSHRRAAFRDVDGTWSRPRPIGGSAADPGRSLITWSDGSTTAASEATARAWAARHRIPHAGESHLALSPDGRAAVVYQTGQGTPVLARLSDATGAWGPETRLDERSGSISDYFPRATAGPDGRWGVVWCSGSDIWLREFDGRAWQPARVAQHVDGRCSEARFFYETSGQAVLVWSEQNGGSSAAVRAAVRDDGWARPGHPRRPSGHGVWSDGG